MAPYATPDQVRQVLAKDLARVEGNAAAVSDEAIAQGIEEASSEIDAKLSTGYTVPFVPIPKLIVHLTIDIAAYLSDLIYREIKDYQSDLSPVYLRYQRAEAMLAELQSGAAVIPSDGTTPSPSTGSGGVVVGSFGRGDLVCPGEFEIGFAGARQLPVAPFMWDQAWGQF